MVNVFILALDGLDYDLVQKWKLRHLKQRVCGKLKVAKDYCVSNGGIVRPYSPLVWTSFITGLKPKDHGVSGFWAYNSRVVDVVRKLPFLAKFKGKRRLTAKLLKPHLQKTHAQTVFDVIESSVALDVVGFNQTEELREQAHASTTADEFLSATFHLFEKKLAEFWKLLEKPWKLFMFYVQYTDSVGHCASFAKLKLVYQRMELLVQNIKKRLKDDCLFLIVSDHGIERSSKQVVATKYLSSIPRHIHSEYAFYSVNKLTDWQPKDITDFKPQIMKWLSQ